MQNNKVPIFGHYAAKHFTAWQHHAACVRLIPIKPAVDRAKEIAVRGIIEFRKEAIISSVTVDLHDGQAATDRRFEMGEQAGSRPRYLERRALGTGIIRNQTKLRRANNMQVR